MKPVLFGAAALSMTMLGACARTDMAPAPVPAPGPSMVSANLMDANGRAMGTASVTQVGDSLRVAIDGMNLSPGAHGVHIHQVGLCTPPGFESAGPHWNPTNHQHGKDNPAGMHKGDLPNVLIGADGRGLIEYTVPMASLANLMDADGASIVVHATADDYRTDPSGNSGGRIACGVLR
ncbi:superoxide dismutase family protein [Allosphingosinicella vermicomposti]|uniref:superoxide dismutase family protein n=1 Tax=Allosphingosinicella vermicomposti TaxID=614671 RepID=UPI001FDFF5E7|nr:superoxide dismutase family protein [Allosphingosinicella vermicomposti]